MNKQRSSSDSSENRQEEELKAKKEYHQAQIELLLKEQQILEQQRAIRKSQKVLAQRQQALNANLNTSVNHSDINLKNIKTMSVPVTSTLSSSPSIEYPDLNLNMLDQSVVKSKSIPDIMSSKSFADIHLAHLSPSVAATNQVVSPLEMVAQSSQPLTQASSSTPTLSNVSLGTIKDNQISIQQLPISSPNDISKIHQNLNGNQPIKISNKGNNQHTKKAKNLDPTKKPFICYKCNKSFAEKRYLTTHLRGPCNEHRSKFACKICKKELTSMRNLKSHELHVHSSIRNHICEYPGCNKAFKYKCDLDRHSREHTGQMYGPCKCGKLFKGATSKDIYLF